MTAAGGPGRGSGVARFGARPRLRAAGLALPLVAFLGVTFLMPLGSMFSRSVYDPVVADALPETLARLRSQDPLELPDEATFAAVARELRQSHAERTLGQIAARAGRIESGLRRVLLDSGRDLSREDGPGDARALLVSLDPAWERPATWRALRSAGERFTARHYLNAVDLERDGAGAVRRRPPELRTYVPLLLRTLWVSLGITGLCLLLGYPVAHRIAHAPPRRARWLLLLVLVPFWTSLLVRTTSWIVLLQTEGVINDLLVALGLVADDGRLQMIYNMTGTFVAMTHVLLPFMVLPLYSVMRALPPHAMRAAHSLGAGPFQAFRRVYWPQTLPGVGAGSLLVFILAIGFYITPALVGGGSGQLISGMIAYHMQTSLNWGLAAAIGGVLLLSVGALYVAYDRYAGADGLRLG